MSPRWREADHPRDGRGRFAEKRGDWAQQLSGRIDPADPYTPGADLAKTLDHQRLHEIIEEDRRQGGIFGNRPDNALGEIYRLQGYHGKPRVVSGDEMDRLVAGGWKELWRGVTSSGAEMGTNNTDRVRIMRERTEQFRRGDTHYPGIGVRGNGTYTTTNQMESLEYTEADGARPYRGWLLPEGEAGYDFEDPRRWPGLTRMALRPDAKVVTWKEISDLWGEHAKWAQYHYRDGHPDHPYAVLGDEGRLAAALGYDAMVVPRAGGDHVVVYNRTALAVQEAVT